MNEERIHKVRLVLLDFFFLFAAFLLAYLIVFSFDFLPKGYQVVEKQETAVQLQSHNLFGVEKDLIYYQPSDEQQSWQIEFIVDLIDNQKDSLLLFFTALLASIFLFITKVNTEEKIIHAFLKSGFLAALLTVFPYINVLNRIQSFVS